MHSADRRRSPQKQARRESLPALRDGCRGGLARQGTIALDATPVEVASVRSIDNAAPREDSVIVFQVAAALTLLASSVGALLRSTCRISQSPAQKILEAIAGVKNGQDCGQAVCQMQGSFPPPSQVDMANFISLMLGITLQSQLKDLLRGSSMRM